ncbi:MAG: HAMP domain-containing protein [Phycisphaerae bacterium]|jgi:methyl-accepting chemotaxis protein WspA|nr:HAMP domain-containing protein [Phycisphaerae bacterium]
MTERSAETAQQTAPTSPEPGRVVSIRTRLLVWITLAAVVPVVLIAVVADRFISQSAASAASARLEEVVRPRAGALEAFAAERLRLLASLLRNESLGQQLRAERDGFGAAFEGLAAAYDLNDVLLVSPDGMVIETLMDSAPRGSRVADGPGGAALAAACESALRHCEPTLVVCVDGNHISPWGVGPVLADERVVGLVAIEIPIDQVRAVIDAKSGLGSTGMVIAASRQAGGWVVTLAAGEDRVSLLPESVVAFGSDAGADASERDMGDVLAAAAAGEQGSGSLRGPDGDALLAAWASSPSFGWSLVASQSEAEALASLTTLRQTLLMAIGVACTFAIGVALGLSRRIASPLDAAVLATRRIAEGDLSEPPEVIGEGEARALLGALRDTNTDLAALIGRIRGTSGEIVRSSGTVLGVAHDQEAAVREFAASVEQVAAATCHMNASSRQLSTTMVGLARAAEFAATTATSGRTALVDLGKQMGRLNEGGRSVASRLEAIRDRAARIDTMVAAITKVANQTNLLAVNAAIEAEKAGAAGHGFQVVAREIDRLATQTAASVLEIEETVVAVQQAVTEGVVEMSHFIDLVDDGCGTANGVASQMGLIIRQAEELRSEFEQVAHSVEVQSQGVEQVNEAMARVSDGAKRTAAAVDRSATVSAALDDAARELDGDVQRFRLPA